MFLKLPVFGEPDDFDDDLGRRGEKKRFLTTNRPANSQIRSPPAIEATDVQSRILGAADDLACSVLLWLTTLRPHRFGRSQPQRYLS
jgi:hypothetical protein